MRLRDWLDTAGHGAAMRLVRDAGIAASTIYDHIGNPERGVPPKPIRRYETAKKISDATGGEVSIAELCEPTPAPTPADASGPHEQQTAEPDAAE